MARRVDGTGENSGLHVSLVPVAVLLGLVGTLLDSVLGATCQYTGYSPKLGKVRPYIACKIHCGASFCWDVYQWQRKI